MKRQLLTTMLCVLLSAAAIAQQVTGKITAASDGAPLPGVSILVKGTTSGTTSDSDGNYSIAAVEGANSILVVSFIGFSTQELTVGTKTTMNVSLAEDITQLGEVVVTALGIEREKKSLGYSVQEVKGSDFVQAREANIINNLQGRVAGVQIYKGGTGPGGSSRIVIRGSNSLGGNDQPMFVVDGVPFDNYNTSDGTSEYGSSDQGQGINQINPDDIETMTVLKGPEAGALYGSRGANGVILITTKKGKSRKGLGVNVNSNLTFETPLVFPDMQNVYGQGSNGIFEASSVNSESSWGPKAEGQIITDYTGTQRPMTIIKDDLQKNFLKTGRSWTNSVDLSGGNDKTTFRLGYTNFDNKGLVPTSTIKRNMVTLRATTSLAKNLSADVKVSYSKQEAHNRAATSGSVTNPFALYYGTPRSIHMSDFLPYKDQNGLMLIWKPSAYSTLVNPYWNLYENANDDKTERYLTMVKLDYKITDWLKVFVRHGMDQTNRFTDGHSAYGMGIPTDPSSYNFTSGYSASQGSATETNADFLFVANKTIDDFSGSLSFGGNRRDNTYNGTGGNTNTLVFPDYYNLSAGTNPRPWSSKSRQRVNSLYAFANLSYKNFLYLDVTFRNDWSSTVSKKNRSFSYPSVSASAIISDMVTMPTFISLLKLRGAYAQTGNTIAPYSLYQTYSVGPGFNNAQSTSAPRELYDANILPESVNSFEFGGDFRFIQSRIGLEIAYYNRSTTDQIIPLPIPGATGYATKFINAGNVTNKGFEFVFSATPVKTTAFAWDLQVNFNHNVNKVQELTPGFTRYFLQSDVNSRAVRVVADLHKPMGDLYGRDFERNDQGQVIVDENGIPKKAAEKNTYLGNYQPKYTLGINNSFSYKAFTFAFLIDSRVGGKIYSQTAATMYANGNAEGTLAYRDGGMIVDGVTDDGTPNTKSITSQQYWTSVAGFESVASQFVYDATNIRLREATLTFNLPNNILSKTPFSRVSIGVVGRNLWLIKNNLPGIDPESTFSVTNAQGVENSAYPSYRSYGFNVGLGF